jgi:uncharacterized protein
MAIITDDKYHWVGAIQTYSGIAFDVIDPQPQMISLRDISQSIAHICRYNGHVPTFYSVAEHSVRVAWLLEKKGYDDNVVLTGLLHDASEAYVGDMVRPLKRHPEFGAVHQDVEERVAKVVHEALGGIFPHPQPVHDADRAVYDWEVEFIRTGLESGWDADYARQHFLMLYHNIIDRMMA